MIRAMRRLLSTAARKIPRLSGVNKRAAVWYGSAIVIVPAGLAILTYLAGEALANNTVLAAKSQTNKTLKQNVDNAKVLKKEVDELLSDRSLALLHAAEGDNNFRVILDALPTQGDAAGFAASLQNVILKPSKVTITKLSAKDGVVAMPIDQSGARTIRFDVEITGDSTEIKTALTDLERSIRPAQVTSLIIEPSVQRWKAHVVGVTYYLPERSVKLEAKKVERP